MSNHFVAAVICALAASVFGVGCSSEATAAGTEVFSVDTSSDVAATDQPALGGPQEHSETVTIVDGEGQATIRFQTAQAPAGGQYVLNIAVTVDDAAGYEVTAGAPGNPVNLGTTEAPVHTRMISIAGFKESMLGSEAGTSMYQVRGDGTVDRQ